MFRLALILQIFFFSTLAFARPVVVFDMDLTLFEIRPRIQAILRDIGEPQAEFAIKGTAEYERVFGSRKNGTLDSTPFGSRFYYDSSYLVYDVPLPGAAAFVTRLVSALDADIIYLTGRQKENFEAASLAQLQRHGFPAGRVILKPDADTRYTSDFKVSELKKIMATDTVYAIFDDAAHNIAAFKRELPATIKIIAIHNTDYNAEGDGFIAEIQNCERLL